ncbi:hypothetical protein CEE44_01490 [Candidatus Woesearchaeota archaeon B3_Woes]|nr:MAG: hypothetical protein CEE44_01490 [Candidatus Woesearchaeota archaeon B3_Woes]
MEEDKKNEESDELKQLDPKKHLVHRVFRKYKEEELIELKRKGVKKPFYLAFPRKTKEFLSKFKHYIGVIVILIFLILIGYLVAFIYSPPPPTASFIDTLSRKNIYGYVYFDGDLVGDTDGIEFKDFPIEYCNETHFVRLESEKDAFEWQTYPIDCKSKKVIFYVDHTQVQPSIYLVFKFLDSTGSFYIPGNLYFDDVFVQKVKGTVSILRKECKNITKIKLEHEDIYDIWDNKVDLCDSYDEIELKSSLK